MLRKKTLFQDKTLTKYDDVIYTVIKVLVNSLVVKDGDGNEFKPKKDVCKIISKNTVVNEIKKEELVKKINEKTINIGKRNKQTAILKKEDLMDANILEGKRERKKNSLYF